MKMILTVLCGLLLCGCRTQRPIELTNFTTGETLHGMAYRFDRRIEVTMPDGEVMVGKWSSIRNDSLGVGFGSATAIAGRSTATAVGNSVGYSSGGLGNVYALLKSTKEGSKLMIEFSAKFDSLNGTGGFGTAKANDGREWKVTF